MGKVNFFKQESQMKIKNPENKFLGYRKTRIEMGKLKNFRKSR